MHRFGTQLDGKTFANLLPSEKILAGALLNAMHQSTMRMLPIVFYTRGTKQKPGLRQDVIGIRTSWPQIYL